LFNSPNKKPVEITSNGLLVIAGVVLLFAFAFA
jgi:hypothetical protein